MSFWNPFKKKVIEQVSEEPTVTQEDDQDAKLYDVLQKYYDVVDSNFEIQVPDQYLDVLKANGTQKLREEINKLFDYETKTKGQFSRYPIPAWYAKIFECIKDLRKIDREKALKIYEDSTALTSNLDSKLLFFNKEYTKDIFDEVIPKIERKNPSFKKVNMLTDVSRANILSTIPKTRQEESANGYTEERAFEFANKFVYVHKEYIELFDLVMNYPLNQIGGIQSNTKYVRALFSRVKP